MEDALVAETLRILKLMEWDQSYDYGDTAGCPSCGASSIDRVHDTPCALDALIRKLETQ